VIKPRFATHVVGKDETLETISLMYFGTRARADVIARANPMLSPPDLKPGREILVPLDPANVQGMPVGESAIVAARTQPPAGLSQEYMVQAGDSLARISKQIYGSEQFASIIFAANRDKLSEPSRIKVGQRLRIPSKPAERAPNKASSSATSGGGGN
jgi:nucleoid-associated protein YgaU